MCVTFVKVANIMYIKIVILKNCPDYFGKDSIFVTDFETNISHWKVQTTVAILMYRRIKIACKFIETALYAKHCHDETYVKNVRGKN